jgi:hypothetical protein
LIVDGDGNPLPIGVRVGDWCSSDNKGPCRENEARDVAQICGRTQDLTYVINYCRQHYAAYPKEPTPELIAAARATCTLRQLFRECYNNLVEVEKVANAGVAKPFNDHPASEHPGYIPTPEMAEALITPSCQGARMLCTAERPCHKQVVDLIRRGLSCELVR